MLADDECYRRHGLRREPGLQRRILRCLFGRHGLHAGGLLRKEGDRLRDGVACLRSGGRRAERHAVRYESLLQQWRVRCLHSERIVRPHGQRLSQRDDVLLGRHRQLYGHGYERNERNVVRDESGLQCWVVRRVHGGQFVRPGQSLS
jgi:hypothetical protein